MREILVAWRWSERGKDERVVGGLKLKNNKIPLNMAIKATDINLSFLTHVLITSSIRRRFHVEQKHTQKVRRWMKRKKIGRIPFFRMYEVGRSEEKSENSSYYLDKFRECPPNTTSQLISNGSYGSYEPWLRQFFTIEH